MIDRTFDFWEAVKCVSDASVKKAPHLLGNTAAKKPKTQFAKSSKKIVSDIKELHKFLADNKKDYVGGVHSSASSSAFTDVDRDKLDIDCIKLIKLYSQSIENLKSRITSDCKSLNATNHLVLHRQHVVQMLESYLKTVYQTYNDLRAIRVKDIVEKKRL